MIDSTFKLILKLVVVMVLISCLMTSLSCVGINASLTLAVFILLTGLALLKRWFPILFKFLKRMGIWSAKGTARWLWKKSEKRGGANIRPDRMRWRT